MLDFSIMFGLGALIAASISMIYTAMHYRINIKPALAIVPFSVSVGLTTRGGMPSLEGLYGENQNKAHYRKQMKSINLTTVLLNVGAYTLYNIEVKFMCSKVLITKEKLEQSKDVEKIQIPPSDKKIFKKEIMTDFSNYDSTTIFYAMHIKATHHFTKSEIFHQIRMNKQSMDIQDLEYI